MRAKIRKVNHAVSIQDANQAHPVEVQSFTHHLGAYQHVHFSVSKAVDDLLVAVFLAGSVQVHALYARRWQQLYDLFFQFFGPKPRALDLRRAAGGTGLRHSLFVAAVVTA